MLHVESSGIWVEKVNHVIMIWSVNLFTSKKQKHQLVQMPSLREWSQVVHLTVFKIQPKPICDYYISFY